VNQDIRLDVGALDHPKLLALEEQLGAKAVLCLVRLWCFTARYRPKGSLKGMTDAQIGAAAHWPGPAGTLIESLISLRLVDGIALKRSVHGWMRRQGYAAHSEERSEAARIAANIGWDKRRAAMRIAYGAHAKRIRGPHAPSPSPSPSPSPDQKQDPAARFHDPDLDPPVERTAAPPASPSVPIDDLTPSEDIAEFGWPTEPGPASNADFEAFIAAYPPRRRHRTKAERAWYSVNGNRPAVGVVLAALERDKASDDWLRERGRYIPGADQWLLDRQWERLPEKEPF